MCGLAIFIDWWIREIMWWTPHLFSLGPPECFVTEWALKGLFSIMDLFMFSQLIGLNKPFITNITLELMWIFILNVSSFMMLQMWWILKFLVTKFTWKRSVTGMNIFMVSQTPGILEFLLTVFTRIFFVALLDMFS